VALEIGVGSGSSLLQLASAVAELHGLDIAEGPVERLRKVLVNRPNVQLFVFDFCQPGASAKLPCRYDLIYSCDTVEHVAAPDIFFANLYAALKPGGHVFVAFPNEHPSIAHGITYFEKREQLRHTLRTAGFADELVTIQTLRLTPAARRVLQTAWYRPRRLAKIALSAFRKRGQHKDAHPTDTPQTFDQTDFYTLGGRVALLSPIINAYCWAVLKLASWARPVYQVLPAPSVLWNTTVLIRAARSR
jgi:SAM-dependent methyltransferase